MEADKASEPSPPPRHLAGATEEAPTAPRLSAEMLIKIRGSIPAKEHLQRWQAAAGLALVGGFGTGWAEQLAPFWAAEHERIQPLLSHLRYEDRHTENAPLADDKVPRTVPCDVVFAARIWLAQAARRRDLDAALAQHDIVVSEEEKRFRSINYISTGSPGHEKVVAKFQRIKALSAALEERGLRKPPVPQ